MYKVAIITLSDKGSKGEREDLSGQFLVETMKEKGYEISHYAVLPDDFTTIVNSLSEICDTDKARLILTTGGTGLSKRDVTPEATLKVITRTCPGIPEAMRAHSLNITKRAMLSRAQAGVRNNTLIINLPGSKKAVQECLDAILDTLPHGLDILSGDATECAR